MVSVIIPTLAEAQRMESLRRAIRSAESKTSTVVVCVNGSSSSADCITHLKSLENVKLLNLPEASLPRARAAGRQAVQTPFFTFLDDDDELLPGGLERRLAVLTSRPDIDLVITNGWRRQGGRQEVMLNQLASVSADPLLALFRENWLPSCGATFRTSSIGPEYFADMHGYAEWTWLAFRLSLDKKRVEVIDDITFAINDTPGSLSKSANYRAAYLHLYRRMLEVNPPDSVRKQIKRKISSFWHDLSAESLARGDLRRATWYHVRSLLSHGGLRYLAYTRHLAIRR